MCHVFHVSHLICHISHVSRVLCQSVAIGFWHWRKLFVIGYCLCNHWLFLYVHTLFLVWLQLPVLCVPNRGLWDAEWLPLTVKQLGVFLLYLEINRTTTKIHIRLGITEHSLPPCTQYIIICSASIRGADSLCVQTCSWWFEAWTASTRMLRSNLHWLPNLFLLRLNSQQMLS